MAGESSNNHIDHVALTETKYTDGEIAYRRRQAKGHITWREKLVLGAAAALILWMVGNVAWASLF